MDLVLRLLCPALEDRLAARQVFDPGAPLLRWNLVTLHDDPSARRPVLLARYLKLDERVAAYLLGADALDGRLRSLAADPPEAGAGALPAGVGEWLQWVAAMRDRASGGEVGGEGRDAAERPPVYLLHGRYGTGRRAAAGALATALGRPLLLLSAAALGESEAGVTQGLLLAKREALLTGALLGWADADVFLHPQAGGEAPSRAFVEALARGRVPVVLLAEKAWEPARSLERRPFLRVGLPDPTYAQRRDAVGGGLARLDGRGRAKRTR